MTVESAENLEFPVPEKCRECPTALFTIALSYAYESSAGSPDTQKQIIEDNCDGYRGSENVTEFTAERIDPGQQQFIAFPVPRQAQLARCALRIP